MSRLLLSLCFLLLLGNAAADEASSPRPNLDFLELTGFNYLHKSDSGTAPFRLDGSGAELRFSWEFMDYIVVTGRARRTEGEPDHGFPAFDLEEDYYELALAFAAPVSERTVVLVELGLADERTTLPFEADERFGADGSLGLYGALGFRARAGWFEFGLRGAGQKFLGVRRHTYSADMRFHVSRRLALGLSHETWGRDEERVQRTGLGLQFKF